MPATRLKWTREEHEAFGLIHKKALETLAERMKIHGVPELPFGPTDDAIIAYRLPADDIKTAGGILIPDCTMDVEYDDYGNRKVTAEKLISNVALILRAGLTALDYMRAHGVFVGDYVKFGRYAGQEENGRWFVPKGATLANAMCRDILQLDCKYILGSFDYYDRVWGKNPTMQIVFAVDEDDEGAHVLKPIVKE